MFRHETNSTVVCQSAGGLSKDRVQNGEGAQLHKNSLKPSVEGLCCVLNNLYEAKSTLKQGTTLASARNHHFSLSHHCETTPVITSLNKI